MLAYSLFWAAPGINFLKIVFNKRSNPSFKITGTSEEVDWGVTRGPLVSGNVIYFRKRPSNLHPSHFQNGTHGKQINDVEDRRQRSPVCGSGVTSIS